MSTALHYVHLMCCFFFKKKQESDCSLHTCSNCFSSLKPVFIPSFGPRTFDDCLEIEGLISGSQYYSTYPECFVVVRTYSGPYLAWSVNTGVNVMKEKENIYGPAAS
jgi:hypothetical protein